jgi:GT2 family glycosyltransferase
MTNLSKPVFIIIPVHNRRSKTLICLETLKRQNIFEICHILVIDDGSSDATSESIRDRFPEVSVISGDGNLWWTGAIAEGMRQARLAGGETFIWLNDDCPPLPGSLASLIEFSADRPAAILGSACYIYETGSLIPTGAKGRSRISAQPGEVIEVDEMSGHCVCVPLAVVDRIGFPDAVRFPHYHGDSSYILKARKAGFSAYLIGDIRVSHSGKIKSSLKDFFDSEVTSLRKSFSTLFLARRSLFFAPAQFHYNVLKYGPLLGAGLFGMKFIWWISQWAVLSLGKFRR